MGEIDNNKMWEAIEKLLDVADTIKASLNKQGLQWNGKEIVSIETELTTSEVTKESDQELTVPENESHIILLDKTMNWDEIRVQAAIAAMQGMLANATLVDDTRLEYRITVEKAAVDYANILVEELKKKGKEL